MSRKHTIEFIREQFEKKDYTLISKEYSNAHSKLDYICPKGHLGSISWHDFQQGTRCRECWIKNKKGKTTPKETRIKQSISAKNRLPFSDETKQKMSDNHANFSGEKHPNYNPNITNEERQIKRNYPEYPEWRIAVFEQANYTCEVCGDNTGGNLEAHHKNSYDNNPEQRTLVENGACLCETCHKNFHHQYGYGDNTKEQFLKFKESYNGSC